MSNCCEGSAKEFNPSEVNRNLFFSAHVSDLFPIVHELLRRMFDYFCILELLVALSNFLLHVGKLNEKGSLTGLGGRYLDELVKNARHLQSPEIS